MEYFSCSLKFKSVCFIVAFSIQNTTVRYTRTIKIKIGKRNCLIEYSSCACSQSRKVWDPRIVGSLLFMALLLFSPRYYYRIEERMTEGRTHLILNLSYTARVLKDNNRRNWWSYWETFEEQFIAPIIWIYNFSMSTMSHPSPWLAISTDGIYIPLLGYQGLQTDRLN